MRTDDPQRPAGGFTRTVLEGGPSADVETVGPVRRGVDFYYRLSSAPWWAVILGFAAVFLAFNLLFAALYMAQPGSLGASEELVGVAPFWRAFFFSVDTVLTIGFGNVYPRTLWANALVVVESLCGLLLFAMVTGLVFARFARPTARILFSRVAVVMPEADGPPLLMFRAVNRRHNLILDARLKAVLLRTERLADGRYARRFHDLPLVREQNPLFALAWQAAHPIDADSPLHGVSADDLRRNGDEIVVLLRGVDEVLGNPIHARHGYRAEHVLWGRRFADILGRGRGGKPVLNYAAFHRTVEVPAAGTPAAD